MKYKIDWIQFGFALLAITCLVGCVVAMFVFPRQPWPITFPLLWIGLFSLALTAGRYEYHEKRGDQ